MKPKIAAQLEPLTVPVDQLKSDPRNPRLHNARNLEAIAGSLRKFGQRKPIVVQKSGMVIRAGNGTVEAAKSLGWDRIAIVLVDDDNKMAEQYAIADNRSAELADWDFENLGAIINEWDDLDIPGFSQAELDVFVIAHEDELTREYDSSSDTGFAPKIDPKASGGEISNAQIAKAEGGISGLINQEAATKQVVCPHCQKDFEIEVT